MKLSLVSQYYNLAQWIVKPQWYGSNVLQDINLLLTYIIIPFSYIIKPVTYIKHNNKNINYKQALVICLAQWITKPNGKRFIFLPLVKVSLVSRYYNLAQWIAKPKWYEFNVLQNI